MSRQRWFCSLCGALITHAPAMRDGYARCRAHAGLPAESSLVPGDPVASLPSRAGEVAEAVKAAREKGQ